MALSCCFGAGHHGKGLAGLFWPRARCLRQNEKKSWRLTSLLGLNFFRLGATLAATVGCLAAIFLGGAVSKPTDPAAGSVLLIILTVTMLVWLVWSTLNWFLSVAAIFVVADGQDTFGAVGAAVNLCLDRPGYSLRSRDVVRSGAHHSICSR